MKRENEDIRAAAKSAGVYLWQVAEALGLHDSAFAKKLRHELPAAEREKVLHTITELSQKSKKGE